MAAVDYAGIRSQLKSILEGDATMAGVRIFVEEEPQFGLMDSEKVIVVFTDSRTAAPADQPLAAGKRTRWHLRTTLWTLCFSADSYRAACDGRDTVLANLELVLMNNRTIGGKVAASWLEGGAFVSARAAGGSMVYVAAAETVLMSEVQAVAT